MLYQQLTRNISPRTQNIKYIVIHDTGNKKIGADADSNFNYFNNISNVTSADFIVDDRCIMKINDYTKNYSWHCGDGRGMYGISNQNSIGIEMCVNFDGYFNKTLDNTVKLVRQLKHLFPTAIVVRHYDASRKNCPASLNYNNWEGWTKFMSEVNAVPDWKEIIKKISSNPDEWENGINAAVAAAKADGNLGALEIFQYLPLLIEKVYKSVQI